MVMANDGTMVILMGGIMSTMMILLISQIQCAQRKRQYKASAKSATSSRGTGSNASLVPVALGGGVMPVKSSGSRETSTEDRSKEKLQQQRKSLSTPGKKHLPKPPSSRRDKKGGVKNEKIVHHDQHQPAPLPSESNAPPSSSKDELRSMQTPLTRCLTAVVPIKKDVDDKTQGEDTESTDLRTPDWMKTPTYYRQKAESEKYLDNIQC